MKRECLAQIEWPVARGWFSAASRHTAYFTTPLFALDTPPTLRRKAGGPALAGERKGWVLLTVLFFAAAAGAYSAPLPRLRVSDNHRFLVTEHGEPFFWLGDTSWAMLQKCVREDTTSQPSILRYLENRARKRFNVLQVRVVGIGGKNAYGHAAFENNDYTKPRIVAGPDNDYWDMADWFVDQAAAHGIYLAWLPIWLAAYTDSHPLVKDTAAAYRYGHFLGSRYGNRTNIIWVLGGDPPPDRDVIQPKRLAMIRAMAEGIADGVNGEDRQDGKADWSTTLMTYHPRGGGQSSSKVLHNEPWLDFNMIQTTTRFIFTNYKTVAADYALQPPKPTLDAEVAYEASLSLSGKEPKDRRTTAWEARKAAYWNVFSGGLGHTYGCRSFIGFVLPGEKLQHGASIPWFEMLDPPGSFHMTHLRNLMESRPFQKGVPDPSVVAKGPEGELDYVAATRAADGCYAMLYFPTGTSTAVRMSKIAGPKVKAWWFDPREGTAKLLGEFDAQGEREFAPPSSGDGHDWVLVLDSAEQGFAAPGQRPPQPVAANTVYFPLPGQGMEKWKRCTPAEAGFKPDGIERLREFILKNPDARGAAKKSRWALWRSGCLVHVEGDFNQTVNVASLRKTWFALAVGAAIHQGKIPSLDEKMAKYLPELKGNDAEATWRHVITQSAGFDYPYGNYPDFKPGEMWTYSDYNPIHLCNALARVYARKDYHDDFAGVMKAAYFDAIGMEGWKTAFVKDASSGMEDGVRLILNLDHMGRLGLLALARGAWNGRELVAREFVEQLESKQTAGMKVNYHGPNDGEIGLDRYGDRFEECPYGFMTWTNSDGNYFPGADKAWAWASGAGGTKTLWNHKNGVVFAGIGIAMEPSSLSIPHIIEESLTRP